MHIEYDRQGGFTGIPLTCHIDTDALPHKIANELLQMIDDSGFFAMQPGEIVAPPAGPPDVFFYRLSISDSGQSNTLSFNDISAPDSLRPLLGQLEKLAFDQKRKDI
jgi:hypothetical protein